MQMCSFLLFLMKEKVFSKVNVLDIFRVTIQETAF